MKYIVELEPGVWISPWCYGQVVTATNKDAKRFTKYSAEIILSMAINGHYKNAKIIEVE